MPRYRSRSRSPVRRSKHYNDPSDHRRERRSPAPSGLLVRNISLSARPEDLRVPFERYGPIKDVYLPKNYYTGEARGFGFVKFRYPEDAAEAKSQLNHTLIGGREIIIVFAEENRKTPQEMRRVSRSRVNNRRRSPSWSPRRRYHSDSRSPSLPRRESRSKLTKRDIKNSRLIKGNEKGMKSQRLLALYFCQCLPKSSLINFNLKKYCFICFSACKVSALRDYKENKTFISFC
ncbi:serine/arginine-rich SC35-like splicing factor SCL28 isoform X2 [Primulina tabacum]|uniref:serine/arginine-rich SC35-like splicing factor SCL28 isoform X2 n=1 Tax=Primulina tabacum TaxID=48773 RepID=UPI003F5AAFDA